MRERDDRKGEVKYLRDDLRGLARAMARMRHSAVRTTSARMRKAKAPGNEDYRSWIMFGN